MIEDVMTFLPNQSADRSGDQGGEKIYVARSVSTLTGTTAPWNLSGMEQL
jgi:hypothetical protein